MAQNTDVDEILSNPSFRNAVHLLGTIIFGYFLLRLVLFFLDATHLGLGWLQAHQNGGFMIIIFILIFSLLVMDVAISRGRRHYQDEKYSIAKVGISYIKEKTEGKTTRSVKPEVSLVKSDVSSLADMIGTVEKDDFMQKPRMVNPILKPFPKDLTLNETIGESVSSKLSDIKNDARYKKETISKMEDITEKPVQEPSHKTVLPKKEITTRLNIEDLIIDKKSGETETKIEEKPASQPIPKRTSLKIEKPTRLGDLVTRSKLSQEPETNIKYKDVIPIKLSYGRRVIKSFDSPHSISVIDFRSKVNKDDAEIKVELLKRSSRLAVPITSKHKIVYEMVNIWVNVPDDNIEDPSIRFNVNKEWVTSNNILTIQIQQYVNGTWNIIPTKRIGKDNKNLFYEAFVTAISAPFAIVGTGL